MQKTFKNTCSFMALTVGVLSIGSFTGAVSAQDADIDLAETEEIIVTSTRRATKLMETPLAITAVGQQDLDMLNVSDVTALNRFVPGLQIRDNSSDGQGSVDINLRGVGNSNFIETAESNVAFNIDGIYTARPQAALQLFNDVERVEVARGPQGTLSGRNATVGSINVIARRPDLEEFSLSGEAEIGRFDAKGGKATLNLPLVEDKLAIRANFARYKRESHSNLIDDEQMNYAIEQLTGGGLSDGNPMTTVDAHPIWSQGNFDPFIPNNPDGYFPGFFRTKYGDGGDTSVGSMGSEDTKAVRASVLFKPVDNFTLYGTFESFTDKALGNPLGIDCDRADCEQFYTPSQVAASGPHTAFLSFKGKKDLRIDNYRIQAEYEMEDLATLSYKFGRSNMESNLIQDLDAGVAIELAFIDGFDLSDPWKSKSEVHDLQLTSAHEGPLQWVAGLFDFSERQDRMMFVSYFHFGAVAFPNHDYRIDTRAAYFDMTYDIDEKTEIFGGIRYTNDKKSNNGAKESRLISPDCAGQIGGSALSLDPGQVFASAGAWAYEDSPACLAADTQSTPSDDSFVDFRIGVNHKLSDDLMVYASIATGHKAALQDQIVPIIRYAPQKVTLPVPTEKLMNYEVGAKGKWNGITFKAAAFFMDYKDKQEAQFFNFGDNNCDLNGNGIFDGYPGGPVPEEGLPGCGIGFDASQDVLNIPDLNDTQFADNIQFAIVPAEKVEIMGLELEASTAIFENGYLSGFATLTKAEYKEFNYSHVLGCPNGSLSWCNMHDVAGNTPRSTPTLTLNATYTHTIDMGEGGMLYPTVNLNYRSKYYLTPENVDPGDVRAADIGLDVTNFYDGTAANRDESELFSDRQDGSLKVNLNLTWEADGGMYAVDVFGTNVTNTKVRSHARIDTANTPLFAWEDPAEYGIRLRVNF